MELKLEETWVAADAEHHLVHSFIFIDNNSGSFYLLSASYVSGIVLKP